MKSFIKISPMIIALALLIASCSKDRVKNIELSHTQKNLIIGETFAINVSISATGSTAEFPISYMSENRSVATVNQNGLVTAVGVGQTNIVVRAGSKSAYCKVTVDEGILNFTSGVQNFWGDLYRIDLNAYNVYLLDNGLNIANNGDIIGTGVFLFLDINTHYDDLELQAGVYKPHLGGKEVPFTYIPGFTEKNNKGEDVIKGSYLAVVKDSDIKEFILITGGNLTFQKSGNQYTVSGSLTTEYNTKYDVQFHGELPLADFVTPTPDKLKKGRVEFFGDTDGNNKANLFLLKLADQSVDMDYFFNSDADRLKIEIGVPLNSDKVYIPSGTYPIQNQEFAVPNYTTGGYLDKNGNDFGSWYYTGDKFNITEGTVRIDRNGTYYTVEYKLKDKYFGFNISGKITAEFSYRDMTKEPSKVLQQMMRTPKKDKSYLTRTTKGKINTKIKGRR